MLLKNFFAKQWWEREFVASWFTHFLLRRIYKLFDAVINLNSYSLLTFALDKTCKHSLHRGLQSLPHVVAVVGVSIFLLE